MKRLARFLKKYRFQVIAGPVFKLIEAIFELIVPLVMADMIDVGVAQGNIQYIWQRGGVLLLLGVVGLASSLTCQTLASRASQGVGTDLRRELFHHINTLSYRELDHFGTPSLITRMTGDINQMQTAVAMLIRLVVRAPFLVIGAVVMAMRIDLELSLVFLAIVPMLSAALYIVMSRSVPFYRLIQRKLDRVSLITRENLSGARVVRAFRKQAEEEKRFEGACSDLAENAIHIGKLSAVLSPFSFIVMNIGMIAILWFGGMRVNVGSLTQGEVVAFINYMTQILIALVVVANLVVIFTKAAASAARINEVFDTQPSIVEQTQIQAKPVTGAPKVSFQDVNFRYYEGAALALKEVSMDIPAGSLIGVIGGTGSGKSTLVSMIPRLYDVSAGRVLLDGVDVRDYPLEQLHGKVGMVPQGNLLFSGTIRENLRWRKPDTTDAELWDALKDAQAEAFVSALPDGLDSRVEQGGKNFSGGQQQRLTIARALVGNPEILILDDCSSALDYATDAALRKSLRRRAEHATVFMVSQRVSTVRGCDRILVMEDGEVVGSGTHAQLLESCPTYQEICMSQMNAEEAGA
ncbi:MAG TPA: ABC transporter ATP-binding protein [Candidatus Egerieenecus merdigallinarum]|nr:ABC transporter ATP-binding protein [Candidatus Egerieenecus merdigallinarum]